MSRIDAQELKARVAGQWRSILVNVAGVDDDLLDGRHHPCPKCGGTDRFRAFDDFEQTGGVLCNQCHQDGGDGLAAVGWMLCCDFQQAVEKIGAHLGMSESASEPVDLIADIALRKHIPLDSFLLFGAHEAARGEMTVCRLPMYGPGGEECSYYDLSTRDKKWLKGFGAKSKPSGLFLREGRLPEAGDTIFITEGPKDAAALDSLGFNVVGISGSDLKQKFVNLFRECHVVIVPDRDEPGEAGAEKSGGRLAGVAASVKVAVLPGELKASGGDGVREVLRMKDGEQLLRSAIDSAADWKPTKGASCEESEKRSQATVLVELVEQSGATLFHTPGGDPEGYAHISDEEHDWWETHKIGTKHFRYWVQRLFWRKNKKVANAQAVQDAVHTLRGMSLFDGKQENIHTRIAGGDEEIFIDLCDERWRCIRITGDGWEVVNDPPVKFVRHSGMKPLPMPVRGGSLDTLRQYVNIESDDDWLLMLGWLLAAFRPGWPYPLLTLQGEQGSSKSTTSRILRSLVDPNEAPLRSAPREERDLMVAATSGWVVGFDNFSGLPVWLADAMCRLATGGGYSARTLFTDADETIFSATRPILLNGIAVPELTTRNDLADRAVMLTLPAIPDDKRRSQKEMDDGLYRDYPSIFGAVLDLVVTAIRELPNVELTERPRMADFAEWAVAGLGDDFLRSYTENRAAANSLSVESSIISQPLQDLMQGRSEWSGTATELLEAIEHLADDKTVSRKGWPTRPQHLSRDLRRIAPNLRAMGLSVESDREGKSGRRVIRIVAQMTVSSVSSVSEPQNLTGKAAIQADGQSAVLSSADSHSSSAGYSSSALASAGNPTKQGVNGVADDADDADAVLPTHSDGAETDKYDAVSAAFDAA